MYLKIDQLSYQLVWLLLGGFLVNIGCLCPLHIVGGCSRIRCFSFWALHDPNLRVMCNTTVIWMSWLLKHLYFVSSVNVDIFVKECLSTMPFAADSCMNDLGDPVSANQSTSVLPQFVLTKNSHHVSLFSDTLFISLIAVGFIAFNDDQSSISSFIYNAASAPTVSFSGSSSSSCSSCCSFMCRTRLICGVHCWCGVFLVSCLTVWFLRLGIGALHSDVKWPILLQFLHVIFYTC